MDEKLERIEGEGNLDPAVGKAKENAEPAMDKIKNAIAGQKTSRQGGMMRMGRREKRRRDRSVKLVLLPCLCDLNEPTARRLTHASERLSRQPETRS